MNPTFPFVYVHLPDSLMLSGQPDQAFEASIKLARPPFRINLGPSTKWEVGPQSGEEFRPPSNANQRIGEASSEGPPGLGSVQETLDDFEQLEKLEDPVDDVMPNGSCLRPGAQGGPLQSALAAFALSASHVAVRVGSPERNWSVSSGFCRTYKQ